MANCDDDSDPVLPGSGGIPEQSDSFQTSYGAALDNVYVGQTAADLPGEFPFTRGIYPEMYRRQLWSMRQYAGYGSARDSNQRVRYLLREGQTGISIAFDLPTQIGYDSDDDAAAGEVGRVGVPISTIDDMASLLDAIPIESVSVSMTINSTAAILLAMFVVVAEERGLNPAKLRGTLQNDVLKEYVARGTMRFALDPSMRLTTDIVAWCNTWMPDFHAISVSGYHIREAGSTAVQEIGFTLAHAIAYVESLVRRGLAVDDFADRFSFFFAAHSKVFEEVAKFRAARRLWAEILRNRFDARLDRSCKLRFHTQVAGSTLAASEIDNNIVRITIQALAAVLGGTQSLHTNARDEAISLPTQEAARTALRTQQIIAYESGIADVADPLGGAPLIESLTSEIADKAHELIREIDELGGAAEAIKAGFPQAAIREAAYRTQVRLDDGRQVMVGVNRFVDKDHEPDQIVQKSATDDTCGRIKYLQEYRSRRNKDELESSLRKLRTTAGSAKNMMPAIINCVRAHATLGEICTSLESVWGRFQTDST